MKLDDATIKKMVPPATGRKEVPDESTPGLVLRVYPDGTRTWTVRVRLSGGRSGGFRRLTLGDWLPTGDGVGLGEARRRAREARARAQLGQDPQRPRKRRASPATLEALAAAFLADMRRSLRPNTLLVYEGRLQGDILPALGQRRPGQITRAHVRALLDDVARRSPSQAIRCRAVLSRLYAIVATGAASVAVLSSTHPQWATLPPRNGLGTRGAASRSPTLCCCAPRWAPSRTPSCHSSGPGQDQPGTQAASIIRRVNCTISCRSARNG